MTVSQTLRIDTSFTQPSPSSPSSAQGLALPPASLRARTPLSSASSYASPMPSTNGSTSSLLIPAASTSHSETSVASSSKLQSPPLIQEPHSPHEYVVAMHDFIPDNNNATCLSFRAGQVIHVLNRDASGWWDGELEGVRGWFPSNYVNGDLGLFVDDSIPSPTAVSNARHFLVLDLSVLLIDSLESITLVRVRQRLPPLL